MRSAGAGHRRSAWGVDGLLLGYHATMKDNGFRLDAPVTTAAMADTTLTGGTLSAPRWNTPASERTTEMAVSPLGESLPETPNAPTARLTVKTVAPDVRERTFEPATDAGEAMMEPGGTKGIEVELFGVPRMVVGRRRLRVSGDSLGAVATALGEACPDLIGRVIDAETGWLLNGYTFVVAERFTTDREHSLEPGMTVLLVSSVAGGSAW